jgi:hypothetical protein
MAGVLRGTQLAQRLAPRAHGALAQRTRGFAAGAPLSTLRAAEARLTARAQTTTARRR